MSVELSKRERRWLRNKKATSIDKVEVYGIQATSVRLHSTDVVQLMQDRIILNTNGWKMNQTSELYDLDYEVFQVNYEWYVKDSRECIHNFYGESVTIKR